MITRRTFLKLLGAAAAAFGLGGGTAPLAVAEAQDAKDSFGDAFTASSWTKVAEAERLPVGEVFLDRYFHDVEEQRAKLARLELERELEDAAIQIRNSELVPGSSLDGRVICVGPDGISVDWQEYETLQAAIDSIGAG